MQLPEQFTKSADKMKVQKVIEYMDDNPRYDFENILDKMGLLKGYEVQGENKLIPCPFHEDYSPSCSINNQRKVYKCFSCGRGGSYIDFLFQYDKLVLGNNLGFYDFIDKIVKADKELQRDVTLSTIFTSKKVTGKSDLTFRKRFKPSENFGEIKTVVELANKVKRECKSKQDIIMFMALVQKEVSMKQIEDTIFHKEKQINAEKLSEEFENVLKL